MERRMSILTEKLQATDASYREQLAAAEEGRAAAEAALLATRRQLSLVRLRYGAVGTLADVRHAPLADVAPQPEDVISGKQMRQLRYEVEQLKRDLSAQYKARRQAEAEAKDAKRALRRHQLEAGEVATEGEGPGVVEDAEEGAGEGHMRPPPTLGQPLGEHMAGQRLLDAVTAASAHLTQLLGGDAGGDVEECSTAASPGSGARHSLHAAGAQVASALDVAGAALGAEAPHFAPVSLMRQFTSAWERVAATDAERAAATVRDQRASVAPPGPGAHGAGASPQGGHEAIAMQGHHEADSGGGDERTAFTELLTALQHALSAARSSSTLDEVRRQCQRVESVACTHSRAIQGVEAPISSSDLASLLCGGATGRTQPCSDSEVVGGVAPLWCGRPQSCEGGGTSAAHQLQSGDSLGLPRAATPGPEVSSLRHESSGDAPAAPAPSRADGGRSTSKAVEPCGHTPLPYQTSPPGSGSQEGDVGPDEAHDGAQASPAVAEGAQQPPPPSSKSAVSGGEGRPGGNAACPGSDSPSAAASIYSASAGTRSPSPVYEGSMGGSSRAHPQLGPAECGVGHRARGAGRSGPKNGAQAHSRGAEAPEAAGSAPGPNSGGAEHHQSPGQERAGELYPPAREDPTSGAAVAGVPRPREEAWLRGDGEKEAFVAATRLHVAGFWQHLSQMCRSIRALTAAEGRHVPAAEVRAALKELYTSSTPVLEAGHRRYVRLVQGWEAHCRSRGKRPQDMLSARVCPVCLLGPGSGGPGSTWALAPSPNAAATTVAWPRERARTRKRSPGGGVDRPERKPFSPARTADTERVPTALRAQPPSLSRGANSGGSRSGVLKIPCAVLDKSLSGVLSGAGSSSSLPAIRRPGGVHLPPESQVRGRWPRHMPADPVGGLLRGARD